MAFARRLAWYAEHGVNIYQFLGEKHVDDIPREQPTKRRVPRKARKPRRPREKGFDTI